MKLGVPSTAPVWVCISPPPIKQLGQTEVGDLGHVFGGQKDIGRSQVAMDDPKLVSGMNRAGQCLYQVDGPACRLRRSGNPLCEIRAVHQLEHQIRQTGGVAQVMDLNDVGMRATGRSPRLRAGAAPEPRSSEGSSHAPS